MVLLIPTSLFAFLAFLFSAATYVFYIRAIRASSARPTISSWISWWIMDIPILAAMVAANAVALQMVAYVIGTAIVITFTLWRGALIGWTRLDSFCVATVLVAVGLWVASGNPSVAVILSVTASIISSVPTAVNVWRDPGREPFLPWLLLVAGSAFGILAIEVWNIVGALTPIVFCAVQLGFALLIFRKFFVSKRVSPKK